MPRKLQLPPKRIWHDSHFLECTENTIRPTTVSRKGPPRRFTFVLQVPFGPARRTIIALKGSYSLNTFTAIWWYIYYGFISSKRYAHAFILLIKGPLVVKTLCGFIYPSQHGEAYMDHIVNTEVVSCHAKLLVTRKILTYIYSRRRTLPISLQERSSACYKLCKKDYSDAHYAFLTNHVLKGTKKSYIIPHESFLHGTRKGKLLSLLKRKHWDHTASIRPSKVLFPSSRSSHPKGVISLLWGWPLSPRTQSILRSRSSQGPVFLLAKPIEDLFPSSKSLTCELFPPSKQMTTQFSL